MLASTGKVFIPAVSEQQARGRIAEVGRLFVGGSKLTVLMALPIAAILAILGQQFIRVWMGPEHMVAAGGILAVLGVTQVFSAPNYIAVGMLYGISRHNIIAWIRLGEAAANLTLSIILGKWIGLIGVALGTAVSHLIVVLIVVPRMVCPIVGIGAGKYLIQTYVRPIAAAAPFIAATVWVSMSIELPNLPYFALATVLLTIVYIPCVYFLALDAAERQLVATKIGIRSRRAG
jgi:O-antigen/teichoic acid export membrane protein